MTEQMERVHALLRDGFRRTLWEIAEQTYLSESVAGAQCRNLRKPKHGSFNVKGERIGGVFFYQLLPGRWVKSKRSRLAELEQENAALRARLAELGAG